jgi:Ca-activated chloride channel family protein
VDQLRGGATEAVPLSFSLTIEDGARYAEPFSPTHALRVRREASRLTVESRERLSGDFALFLPFADRPIGITVASHRPDDGEDGWFMLTLSPAEVERARRVPRDVTVVLDVSGSMSGGKLEQAQGAVRQVLSTLGTQDRLRLVRFHSTVAEWRSGWATATAANLRDAREWVAALRAEGSTNIAGALERAFAERSPAGRLGVVLFLTDGLPTVGERDPERIARQAERGRGEARVFAFGVGYDVNTYLLDRLSAAARGSTQYVKPEEDIETAVSALTTRIQYPVLTDLALSVSGAQVSEVYPGELPDLFAGDELVVFGRYSPRGGSNGDGERVRGAGASTGPVRAAGSGTVTISGRRANAPERYAAQATFARHAPAHDYIPRLWASRKIGELTQELRLHGHNQELVEDIRQTALRYGVLSEYTSYLVQEPGMVLAGERVRDQLASPTAPSAFVGQAAVMASAESKARREVSSVAELHAADQAAAANVVSGMDRLRGAGAGVGGAARAVAGRTFRERDGVWEDVLHQTGKRVVEVRAYSAAYFELLRALPELKGYVSELPQVLVAGAGVSVRVHAERGQERLTAEALAKLVRDFRGDRATTP